MLPLTSHLLTLIIENIESLAVCPECIQNMGNFDLQLILSDERILSYFLPWKYETS
jgi:hypothetical protein